MNTPRLHARGEFLAETGAAQVVIEAMFDGQRLVLADGSPLPLLRRGSLVRLRVNALNICDPAWRRQARQEQVQTLLPAGQRLWALADLSGLQALAREGRLASPELTEVLGRAQAQRRQVDVRLHDTLLPRDGVLALQLHEPLRLSRCGDKPARLLGCRCAFPEWPDEIDSFATLNQAMHWMSQQVEVHRASHAVNVFRRVLVPCESWTTPWKPGYEANVERLDDLRRRVGWAALPLRVGRW